MDKKNTYHKLIKGNEIVRVSVHHRNGKYMGDRTVYTNENGLRFIKANGQFIELGWYYQFGYKLAFFSVPKVV